MAMLTTEAVNFLGERPELPPEVVRFLRERTAAVNAPCGANGDRIHHWPGCGQS